MILDKLNMFGTDQAVTATAASTDVIDMGVAQDLGVGDDPALKVICQITETFTAAGAATLVAAIQGSVDNSAWTTMAQTGTIAVADLTVGRNILTIDLPSLIAGQALPRYLRMNYTVATGPMTAGKITAGLNLDRQQSRAYPPGITIAN